MLLSIQSVLYLLVLLLFVSAEEYADDLSSCPKLPKRDVAPTSVHDLRPDDIQVVAAIGDSITCGVAAKNVDTPYFTREQFKEYRGLSFTMGGDEGAVTVPNFFAHYSGNVVGASRGSKVIPTCPETFFCLNATEAEEADHLNAAVPAATSDKFMQQAQYLIQRLGPGTDLEDNWKFITVYIGADDLAVSCMPGYTVLDYFAHMDQGIDYLKKHLKKAFINLVGMMHIEQVLSITDKIPGYRRAFQDGKVDLQHYECYCCHSLGLNLLLVGKLSVGLNVPLFNRALESLAERHADRSPNATVTVVYQPMDLDMARVPPESLSNLDGYHPNVMGHQFLAKAYWNQLYLPKREKVDRHVWDPHYQVRCPLPTDRLQTQ